MIRWTQASKWTDCDSVPLHNSDEDQRFDDLKASRLLEWTGIEFKSTKSKVSTWS